MSKKKFKYLVTFQNIADFNLRFKIAKLNELKWLIVRIGSMKEYELEVSSLEYALNTIKQETIFNAMREQNVTRNKARSLIGKMLIEEI